MADPEAATDSVTEQQVAATSNSVLELTRDLLKPSLKEEGVNEGIDWDFGNDDNDKISADISAEEDEEDASDGDDEKTLEIEPEKTSVFDIADVSEDENENEKEEHLEGNERDQDEKEKEKKRYLYTESELLKSCGSLFADADHDQVTVKDIVLLLETEYDCKLPKKDRKRVKQHLIRLMTEKEEEKEEEEKEEEDIISEQGDVESEYEAEDEGEEEDGPKPRMVKKKTKKKTNKTQKEKIKRPNQRKAAKAARLVEAMRLRKKRVEELKIRKEEFFVRTKEDEERAEKIAAKLDTNSEEQRVKRLEDRLDLLDKLDRKRIQVLEYKDSLPSPREETSPSPTPRQKEEEEDENSSSEEEDLVLVGIATKKFQKPLPPTQHHVKASALKFLDHIKSPERRKHRLTKSNNHNARFALRNALKQKQRSVGNRWLARELGYNTEQEHLKDCRVSENKKLVAVKQREKKRVQANERKLLRERLLYQEEEGGEEEELEIAPPEVQDNGEEEDEEMQMAKQLEKKQLKEASELAAPVSEASTVDESSIHAEESEGLESQPPLVISEIATPATEISETDESAVPKPSDEAEDAIAPESAMNSPTEASASEIIAPESIVTDDISTSGETESFETQPPPVSAAVVREVTTEQQQEDSFNPVSPAESQQEDKPRNAGWKRMLEKEALQNKKNKKGKNALVEQEAEEEEEEEVAGLEDFGFSISKKKKDDEEDDQHFQLDEDDLKHVVDDVSDNEGDEEAGQLARQRMQQKEEQLRHREMLRRMREGYDGRRGGIGSASGTARGIHRFDQLVSADNKEDAKRLGLLNDDEVDSDDDESNPKKDNDDEEEDEAALVDKMLKDRFLHRSNVELEENFSEDEEEEQEEENGDSQQESNHDDAAAEKRLAKRFAKRARMSRLEEEYGDNQEFSQQRLMDDSMKLELKQMKCGLVRKQSSSSKSSFSQEASSSSLLVRKTSTSLTDRTSGSSLSLALRASRTRRRTSFLGSNNKDSNSNKDKSLIHKSVALSHVVFSSSQNSRSNPSKISGTKRKLGSSSSLFRSVAGGTSQ
jgi:hypothetical protein